MSCIYCGGDYCGSSAGGPSMCENSPTYNEIVQNKQKVTKQTEGYKTNRRLQNKQKVIKGDKK
jgi:hypothetical protein